MHKYSCSLAKSIYGTTTRRLFSSFNSNERSVVIVSAKRTAIGSFMGMHKQVSGPQLGTTAIRGVLDDTSLNAKDVDENFFGCVLQAGLNQAPDRQILLAAGGSVETPSTCVNKHDASGMKAVMLGANQIRAGDRNIVIAGGMEHMTKAPHYLQLR